MTRTTPEILEVFVGGFPGEDLDLKPQRAVLLWGDEYPVDIFVYELLADEALGGVPADAAAPEFCEIAGEAVVPAPGGKGNARFPLTGGGELEVTGKTAYTPWLTRQIVGMDDLVPGTRVLVWKDKDGAAEKVQLLPSVYQGYVRTFATMHDVRVAVNGGFDAELKKAGRGRPPVLRQAGGERCHGPHPGHRRGRRV